MARITILIPLFSGVSPAAFEETLASVLAHRPSETEILVANGTDYADPWNISYEGVDFLPLRHLTNPVDLLNEAAAQSHGTFVHVLLPGTEVSEFWTAFALKQFENKQVGVVIPKVLDRRRRNHAFTFGVRYNPEGTIRTVRHSIIPDDSDPVIVPHIAAAFFRREALFQAGLFDRNFYPQISYVDTVLTMEERGWKTVLDEEGRIHVQPNQLPSANVFSWGVQVERLYFRRLGRNVPYRSLRRHFGSFFADFWRHLPKWRAFQILFGRMTGLMFFGETLPFVRRRRRIGIAETTPLLSVLPFGTTETGSRKVA